MIGFGWSDIFAAVLIQFAIIGSIWLLFDWIGITRCVRCSHRCRPFETLCRTCETEIEEFRDR